jgi:iron complex transport system permease protein
MPSYQAARHDVWTYSAIGLAVSVVLSLAVGATGVTLNALPSAMAGVFVGDGRPETLVLLQLRLPRMLLGAFVGAALALSGTIMQGLFRNPLADPGLIGVSSGAALAAVTFIALGNTVASPLVTLFGVYALPVAAFVGGLATTFLLVAISQRSGTLVAGTLLLAGIAIAAFSGAMTGLLAYASDDRELRDLTLWSMGSLSGANWHKVLAVTPFALLMALMLPRSVRALNGFLLGEAEAYHLGIDVEREKRRCVLLTAIATGAAVAVAGILGFVGIVIPHLVRLLVGPDHRLVLPLGAIIGASLVLLADIAARMMVRPAELPLGLVLAVVGAPIFLHIVVSRHGGGS